MAGIARTPKAEMHRMRTEAYLKILDDFDSGKKQIACSTGAFNAVFESWKNAAKECGLSVRHGCVFSGNNRYRFPYLYMPRELVAVPNDLGEHLPIPRGGYWVFVQRREKGLGYFLSPVREEEGTVSTENIIHDLNVDMLSREHNALLQQAAAGCLDKRLQQLIEYDTKKVIQYIEAHTAKCITVRMLDKLLDAYAHMLKSKVALGVEYFGFSGWTQGHLRELVYFFGNDTVLDTAVPNTFSLPSNIINTRLSALLFCAAIFSFSKPLLTAARLPTDFVLYFKIPGGENYENRFNTFEAWIDFFCNPRKKKSASRFKRDSVGFLSPVFHHNFPLLYCKADPTGKNYEPGKETLRYSKKEMNQLQKASCLPILLSPASSEKAPYPETLCLEVSVPRFEADYRFDRRMPHFCQQLFDCYSTILTCLSRDSKKWIAQAKKCYAESLLQLYCTKKTASDRQKQVACLLTAVHIAEEALKAATLIEEKNNLFPAMFHVLESLEVKRKASEFVFAKFVRGLLDNPNARALLLDQDDECVYLSYDDYWNAFEEYCNTHHVLIAETPLEFRRKYLAQLYLKPQYVTHDRRYTRYDYRKIINDRKEKVLAVKKSILQLIPKNRISG